MEYLRDLGTSLSIYFLASLSLYGWGAFIAFCVKCDGTVFDKIWLGFSGVLLLVQIIHILIPISASVSLALGVIGIGLCCMFKPQNLGWPLSQEGHSAWRRFSARAGIVCCVMILASEGMLTPINFDSGLYHFNAIRWLNEYPLVFGIGNLHGRLAYNQVFFGWAALLNIFPFYNHGHNVANSLLMGLLFAECVHGLFLFVNNRQKWTFSTLFSSLCIPVLLFIALKHDLSSPTPDISVLILQFILLGRFLRLVERKYGDTQDLLSEVKWIVILSATSVTCKLSTGVFSFVLMMTAILWCVWCRKVSLTALVKHLRVTVLLASLIIGVWWGKGIAQSGVPMYPATFLWIDADWSIPLHKMENEANWIYSWARQPHSPWQEVLGSWQWFDGWLQRLLAIREFEFILALFAVSGVLLLFAGTMTSLKRVSGVIREKRPFFLAYIPVVSGLMYWFFSAPDFRFARGLFWFMALLPLTVVLSLFSSFRHRWIVVAIVGGLLTLPVMDVLHNKLRNGEHFFRGYEAIKKAELRIQVTDTGLEVYTPSEGASCWDSPLPATPYFSPHLCLRGASLASGFSVTCAEREKP